MMGLSLLWDLVELSSIGFPFFSILLAAVGNFEVLMVFGQFISLICYFFGYCTFGGLALYTDNIVICYRRI
jgi:hypothetical protein